MKKVAIIDYGAGNLKNVDNAIKSLGLNSIVSKKKEDLNNADALILPGVGAFGDAMTALEKTGLIETIKNNIKKGKFILGICLGMQMFFDRSFELQETDGLGLIQGDIIPFRRCELKPNSKIPHMGWNSLEVCSNHPFLKDIKTGDFVYFVHSYYAKPKNLNEIAAWADYNVLVPGVVIKENVIGTQFHPEKSSNIGFKMLKNFSELI